MKSRPATPDDAAGIAAIYSPIVERTTISFELVAPTVDEMRARIVATTKSFPWLVSEDARGIVNGYVYASKHRDPPAYRWSVNTSVCVREDARGQGVGKRLYLDLLKRLAELGYFQAFAGIALPNDASVALHESVGFQPLGVYRQVGFKFGAWRDVGWWQCPLTTEPTPEPSPPRAP